MVYIHGILPVHSDYIDLRVKRAYSYVFIDRVIHLKLSHYTNYTLQYSLCKNNRGGIKL